MIIINPLDNVGIALCDLTPEDELDLPDGTLLTVLSDIAYSHKVALEDIPEGSAVLKYGEMIGRAKSDIRKGDWVHKHNLDTEEKMGAS